MTTIPGGITPSTQFKAPLTKDSDKELNDTRYVLDHIVGGIRRCYLEERIDSIIGKNPIISKKELLTNLVNIEGCIWSGLEIPKRISERQKARGGIMLGDEDYRAPKDCIYQMLVSILNLYENNDVIGAINRRSNLEPFDIARAVIADLVKDETTISAIWEDPHPFPIISATFKAKTIFEANKRAS